MRQDLPPDAGQQGARDMHPDHDQLDEELLVNPLDSAGEARLYRAMRHFWHPVLYSSELTDQPKQVFLLDEQLVLARLDGGVRCFADLCVHRGTPLSRGRVEGDQIRCAYHGWTYGPDGVCTSIPARFGSSIPRRARLTVHDVCEKNGMIWVCLEEPRFPVPEFPEYGDASFRVIEVPPYDWRTSAQRRIENYVDISHFAWVHDGVLGDHEHPEVQDFDVTVEGNLIRFAYPNQIESPDIGKNQGIDASAEALDSELQYRLFMPGTVILEQPFTNGAKYALFFAVCPVSAKHVRNFTLMARNYMLDDPEAGDRSMLEYNDLVIGQDQPVVEPQRPEMLPFDLSAELHIRGVDRVSLEYRKWLIQQTNELVLPGQPA
jgi:phenylpropionate dioxygenase-like ring-hydroxylating dioxygenase large terminal subunit